MKKIKILLASILLQATIIFILIKFDGWTTIVISIILMISITYSLRRYSEAQETEGKIVSKIAREVLKFIWSFTEMGLYLWCAIAIFGNLDNKMVMVQYITFLLARILSYSIFSVEWRES